MSTHNAYGMQIFLLLLLLCWPPYIIGGETGVRSTSLCKRVLHNPARERERVLSCSRWTSRRQTCDSGEIPAKSFDVINVCSDFFLQFYFHFFRIIKTNMFQFFIQIFCHCLDRKWTFFNASSWSSDISSQQSYFKQWTYHLFLLNKMHNILYLCTLYWMQYDKLHIYVITDKIAD